MSDEKSGFESWGQKVDKDLKEELNELKEKLNLSGHEFMSEILSGWKMNNLKRSLPILSNEMDELERICKRIPAIYANFGSKVELMLMEKEACIQGQVEKYEEIISLKDAELVKLSEEIESTQERNKRILIDFEEMKDQNKETVNNLVEKVNHLNMVNQSHLALTKEYEEKNKRLNEELADYKMIKSEYLTLQEALDDVNQRNRQLEQKMASLEKEMEIKNCEHKGKLEIESRRLKLEYEELLLTEKQGLIQSSNTEIDELRRKMYELEKENAKIIRQFGTGKLSIEGNTNSGTAEHLKQDELMPEGGLF